MMIPVRCFTCGKVLGQFWEDFQKRVEAGEDPKKVLDEMGVRRYCCRQTIVSNVDLIKEISKFKP
jgi:DNA-directed RNA polymerase subunit N